MRSTARAHGGASPLRRRALTDTIPPVTKCQRQTRQGCERGLAAARPQCVTDVVLNSPLCYGRKCFLTRQLLDRLFLTPDEDLIDCGIMTIQLYKDGEWSTVTIDTRIPWGVPGSQLFNTPLYARCADPSELWVMLLEKAMAKIHGSYVRDT